MAQRNPFTPTFGMVPPFLAGRERILSEMAQAFDDGLGNPNLSTILIGARGTGKTALLSCIADEAQAKGWLAVNTVASEGMLEDIIQQAGKAAAHLIDPAPARRLSAVGVGQILSLEWVFDQTGHANWRSRIEALLDQIEEHGAKLLITVDEVSIDVEEMVQLVSTYQLLIRDGRQVALVMAGLPMNVTSLIDDERVTFLRRARQHYLGRIDDKAVRQAMSATVRSSGKQIEALALDTAVAAIGGFAYLMQLIGYFMWMESGDATVITQEHASRGVEAAREDFKRGVIEATYREMSSGDRAFVHAMLPDKHGSRLAEIARRMDRTTSYASTYKRRLLKLGVINESVGGVLDFELPMLREFLIEVDAE